MPMLYDRRRVQNQLDLRDYGKKAKPIAEYNWFFWLIILLLCLIILFVLL